MSPAASDTVGSKNALAVPYGTDSSGVSPGEANGAAYTSIGPGSPFSGAYALTIRTFAPLARWPADSPPPPAGTPTFALDAAPPDEPELKAPAAGPDPPGEHP